MARVVLLIVLLIFSTPVYSVRQFDFDKEFRQELKGIIIHHTGTAKDNPTIEFLSDIQKTTVYKPVFDVSFPGQKKYSNHFYNNKETFFCYHWIVYPDGKKVQVLKDVFKQNGKWYVDNVAWHAGTWEINGKTLGIAVAGNYMNRQPSDEALKAVAEIIAGYEKTTGIDLTIQGHREVKATECPGNRFLGRDGWKNKLIKLVDGITAGAE